MEQQARLQPVAHTLQTLPSPYAGQAPDTVRRSPSALHGSTLTGSTSTGVGITFQAEVPAVDRRPRLLTHEACLATELVAHAMEYLSDSRELSNGKIIELDQNHPDVFALLLLMEARYSIYVSCPVIERRKNTLAGMFKGKDRRRPR